MLSIQSFAKSFDGQRILSIDALNLSPGVHFIKGDNGSGKTSLFRCLAGISPHDGSIRLDDAVLSKDPVAYRFKVPSSSGSCTRVPHRSSKIPGDRSGSLLC